MGYSVVRTPILAGSNLDGRRRAARRVKEVIRQFTAAVGGKPTPGQIVLIRMIAELTAVTEAMRTSMLAGGVVDFEPFGSDAQHAAAVYREAETPL